MEYPHQDKIRKLFTRCREDFFFFSKHCLVIKDKKGKHVNLYLNEAQVLVHKKLEEQKKRTGRVRALIIKGRQQGISTYAQARFVWTLIHNRGLRAYILTHLADSTQALFAMTKRYIDHLPAYRPELGKCNVNELYFSGIDSGYKVGTAGSHGVGRGETLQLFHGSELAYWPKPEEHIGGILQAVPETEGTEIILESTANGTGNIFHQLAMESLSKTNDFELIFVPWMIQKEYSIEGVDTLILTEEEKHIKQTYQLTDGQLRFRRQKIAQLGDVRRFRQEYPLSIQDAFVGDTDRSFIGQFEIEKASGPANPIVGDKEAPVIIGIDPSGKGKDASAYCVRVGRIVERCEEFRDMVDTMELVGEIGILINRYTPDRVFIDVGGLGAPIYDRLRERGYRMVEAINFQERPDDVERYANKRAEIYDRIKQWLNAPPCQLPDNEQLKSELTMSEYTTNSSGKLLLKPKKDLPKSPNLADAMALTFSRNIPNRYILENYSKTFTPDIDWNPYGSDRSHNTWQ